MHLLDNIKEIEYVGICTLRVSFNAAYTQSKMPVIDHFLSCELSKIPFWDSEGEPDTKVLDRAT